MNSTLLTVAARADALAQAVLTTLGVENVVSIFAGGSLASNDIAAYDAGSEIEIYSDIDVYVVIADNCDEDRARDRVGSVVSEFDGSRRVGSFIFVAPSDVGVYKLCDIATMTARPGTVCLRAGRLLYGERGAMESAPEIETPIPTHEALYLIENRMTEMAALMDREDATGRRYAKYHALKLHADAGTALLVAKQQFTCDSAARILALESLADKFPSIEIGAIIKAMKQRTDLNSSFDKESNSDTRSAMTLALSCWKAVAEEIRTDATADWVASMAGRCRQGRSSTNLREFIAMRVRQGEGKLSALRMGVSLSAFSSVSSLRLSGVARHASAVTTTDEPLFGEIESYVDRLTRRCGFTDGTLPERVMQMNRSLR